MTLKEDLIVMRRSIIRLSSAVSVVVALVVSTFLTACSAPPVELGIFSVAVETNSDTSVTITWVTDREATSQVEYGTTTAYGTTTTETTALENEHSVAITGLDAGTPYHYRVISTDANDVWAQSADKTFNTTELAISGAAADPKSNTAVITWITDDASSSQVEYGTSATYGITTTLDATEVTSHSVILTNLTPATTYHYRVLSATSTDTDASADATFVTDDPVVVTAGVIFLMDTQSPLFVNGTADTTILSRVYEPLVVNTGDGTAEPWLASSWSWDEATLTYTMNIDPDAMWSDGQPVTATDVKYSWDTAWEFDTPGGADTKAFMPQTVADVVDDDAVTIVDASTVTFTLSEPNATFLNDMSGVYIIPEHIWTPIEVAQAAKTPAETIETYVNENPVGSGPFLWEQYTEQSHVLLKRDPDYWGGPMNEVAKIDEVVFKLYGTDEAMLLALQSGEIDIVNDISLYSQIPNMVGDSNITVGIDDSANFFNFLYMNLRVEPINELAVRQAIDLAIDKEDLIAFAQQGYGSISPLVPLVPAPLVSDDVVWPGVGETDEDRIADANDLLDGVTGMSDIGEFSAGVRTYDPPGVDPAFDLVFTLYTEGTPIGVTNGDIISENLAEIGITLNVEVMGTWPMVQMLFFGESFDLWSFAVFGHGATPGIQGLVQEFGADPWNVWYDSGGIGWGELGPEGNSGPAALAAQAKLREVRREAVPAEFATLVEEAQILFAADLPIVVLYQAKLAYAYRIDTLTGWNPYDLFDGFGSSGFLCSNPNLISLEAK